MTPGEGERAARELDLAADALRASDTLLKVGLHRDAASRLYYATSHAVRAALAIGGLTAKSHSGQLNRFSVTYGPAPVVGRLLDLRTRADYGADELTESATDLRALIDEAGAFVERCRRIVADRLAAGPDQADPAADR